MNDIRKTILTSLIAASVGITALPAGAATPVLATFATEIDDFTVNTVGYDLGGPGVLAGAALTPARVIWAQTASGVTNKVEGSIYFDGVSQTCARVKVVSLDASGNSMVGSPTYSSPECVTNNNYFERPFTVEGIQGASEIQVRLQTAANVVPANQVWGATGNKKIATYGPDLGVTEVSIAASEFDLGTGAFAGGTAPDPATVTWTVAGADEITPSLSGTLYMNNADDLCGRMRYTYMTQSILPGVIPDAVLETRYGTEHCVTDNQLHTFAVNTGNYANVAVDKVEIAIEYSSRDVATGASTGNWLTKGSVTTVLPSVLIPVW